MNSQQNQKSRMNQSAVRAGPAVGVVMSSAAPPVGLTDVSAPTGSNTSTSATRLGLEEGEGGPGLSGSEPPARPPRDEEVPEVTGAAEGTSTSDPEQAAFAVFADVCQRFYFHQDDAARKTLDAFSACESTTSVLGAGQGGIVRCGSFFFFFLRKKDNTSTIPPHAPPCVPVA